jgi:tripartite ATP-independent transporter DctP family solute receptor
MEKYIRQNNDEGNKYVQCKRFTVMLSYEQRNFGGVIYMFKKFLSIAICGVFVTGILSGCSKNNNVEVNKGGTKPADNQIFLRLAESHQKNHPTTIGDKEFARLVEERSNGRISIIVYPEAQLGQEKSIIEQVKFGAIDFARVSTFNVSQFVKELDVIQLPYLYRNVEHMWKVLEGPIGDELLKSIRRSKLVGLAFYDDGAKNFYSKKEVKSVTDLKGLKIRVQQSSLMIEKITALGASPIPMDIGGVYNGLLTGAIDGAENNISSYISDGHVEVAKYILLNEHTRVPEILVASSMVMDKLSKEDQELIIKAAKDSAGVQKKASKINEKNSVEKSKSMGVKVTTLDEKALTEFQNAVQPLYDNIGKGYKDLIKRIQETK